jgi:hypothetical protein
MPFVRQQFKGWIKDFDLGKRWYGPSRYIPPPERIGDDAYQRASVYFWCWSYMRLSPALMYARVRGVEPRDPALAKVLINAGDLSRSSFDVWWRRCGMAAFAELTPISRVQVVPEGRRPRGPPADDSAHRTLHLEVPLTIRPRTIVRQVKALLKEAGHVGQFDPAPFSTAPFPLYTLRYRVENIERRYWVLVYRLLYPEVPVWMIGARLGLMPAHMIYGGRGSGSPTVQRRIDSLQSITGRHLYKSRYMLTHLEHGDFPRDNPIKPQQDWSAHFGQEHAADYQLFVEGNGNAESEWIRRLKRTHLDHLKEHVIKIKTDRYKPPMPREVLVSAEKYMRGEKEDIRPEPADSSN